MVVFAAPGEHESQTDYLHFYGELKDMPLAVSPETGRLLYMLARSGRARTIVEYGTSFRHLDLASRGGAPRQRRRPARHL